MTQRRFPRDYIQSTLADAAQLDSIAARNFIKQQDVGTLTIGLQTHDEVVVEVADRDAVLATLRQRLDEIQAKIKDLPAFPVAVDHAHVSPCPACEQARYGARITYAHTRHPAACWQGGW